MPGEFDDDPTHLDEVPALPEAEVVTAPHRTLAAVDEAFQAGRDAGCRGCYSEGQEDAIRALREVFEEHGGVDEAALHVLARVREKLSVL